MKKYRLQSKYNIIVTFILMFAVFIFFPGKACYAHGGLGEALLEASLAVHFTATLLLSLLLVLFLRRVRKKFVQVFLPCFLTIFIIPPIIIFSIIFFDIERSDAGIIKDYIIIMLLLFISLIMFYVNVIGKKIKRTAATNSENKQKLK